MKEHNKQVEFLPREQISEYVSRAQKGDTTALDMLLKTHMPYIKHVISKTVCYDLCYDDLIQEGCIGFIKSVYAYDVSKNTPLVSYSFNWVKNEVKEYVYRNKNIVNSFTTKESRKLMTAWSKLRGVENKKSSEFKRDVSQYLGVPEIKVDDIITRTQVTNLSIVADDSHEREGHYSESFFADVNSNIEDNYCKEEDKTYSRETITQALKALPERHQKIVRQRFLTEEPPKLRELADELCITSERVRQLEHASLKKMKLSMAA